MKFPFLAVVLSAVMPFLSHAQYANYRVSHPASKRPNEVTIAVNPVNPLNLAAGANLKFYYYSTDGGKTWTEGELYSLFGVWGDPCVTFDPEGNLYFAHLSNPIVGYWIDRIVVQKSTNEGVTWNDGAGIGFLPPKNQDKEWMIADHTQSQFRNRLYIAWTEFDKYGSSNAGDSSRIRFSSSTDFGDSWSAPVVVSDVSGDCIDSDNTVEGAVPAVGPDGEVYLSWAGPLGIMFDKSVDGGLSFGKDVFVTDMVGGWDFAVPGIYRCNGMPVTLCDISQSPFRGRIYVLWSDQRNGSDNTDVFCIKSDDGGATWDGFKKVNDDHVHRHQFFHWATVDPVTGNVYVVFYDRRSTSGTDTDVYLAKSSDGGETFENIKISESSFTPNENVFFGDYINVAAYDGVVHPIWMRMDGNNMSIWTAVIDEVTPAVPGAEPPVAATFSLSQSYPNPFNPVTSISYRIAEPVVVHISVFDVAGRLAAVLVDQFQTPGEYSVVWDASGLQSGIYFYRLSAGKFRQQKKCILVR